MMKKLHWRLSKLPNPEEVRELVKDKIITQEEAREILFTSEDIEYRDVKSLESEIKFLRSLIETLSKNSNKTIVETIREVERPWRRYDWYEPYHMWCGTSTNNGVMNLSGADATNSMGMKVESGTSIGTFKDIKTF